MLLRLIQSGKLPAARLVTHRALGTRGKKVSLSFIVLLTLSTGFKFDQIEQAYKTFTQASQTGALKVLIDMEDGPASNNF
jgi:threonine dehydrogenase-like Zn-dependent dehydrogenase